MIFPLLDSAGHPVGFAGRLVSGDGPKYLNGPETGLYKKRTLLYGLHAARRSNFTVQISTDGVAFCTVNALAGNEGCHVCSGCSRPRRMVDGCTLK